MGQIQTLPTSIPEFRVYVSFTCDAGVGGRRPGISTGPHPPADTGILVDARLVSQADV